MGDNGRVGDLDRAVEDMLLEREAELGRVRAALRGARAGSGRTLIVEGQAGIGKTALRQAGCDLARDAGMRVLEARAADLEREFGFGLVRQLFEPLMRSLPEAERDELLAGAAALAAPLVGGGADAGPVEPGFPVLHGLYWLLANLADRGPLLLAIDDVQWSDAESLRFVAFLLGRLHELPVALVLTHRAQVNNEPDELLALILADPLAERLQLGPLSVETVARLIERRLGAAPDDAFTRACHAAVSGNPMLLDQLLGELALERIGPTAEQRGRVARAVPRAVAQMLRMRFARLSDAAPALARAVAVLGDGCELRLAAAFAGLDPAAAGAAADELALAEVLRAGRPLEFVHPIVRETLYRELAPGARSAAHVRAAALLREDGAASERLAAHLLATDPAGDAHVVDTLRAAARSALESGAPHSAVAYLRRALAEPPVVDARAEALAQLGRAELAAGDGGASDRLLDALALTRDPAARAALAADVTFPLVSSLRVREALQALRETADQVRGHDADAALGLDMQAQTFTHHAGQPWSSASVRRVRTAARRRPAGRLGRIVAATAAYETAVAGESAAQTRELCRRALEGGDLDGELAPASPMWTPLMAACACCELFDPVDELLAAGLTRFRARGSVFGVMQTLMWRSYFGLRRGAVTAAVADAREFLDIVAAHSVPFALPAALAVLLEALVERGDLDAAETALQRAGAHTRPGLLEASPAVPATMAMAMRGWLRLAQDRPEEALADLLEAGRRCDSVGIVNPARLAWRSHAALAQHALGTADGGRELAREELRLAHSYGAPRAIGIALRSAGLVEGGQAGIGLLQEAVGVLASSPARLEHARALIDLGIAQRAAGQRVEARDCLRPGLGLAHTCGAHALAAHARSELVATGARPRRVALSGAGSLTASERRVALLAAEGHSNVEIAQALFVTRKTVEAHLSHAYGKLGISSRAELAGALAGATPA